MDRLSWKLMDYVFDHGSLPYDPRGSEYALYALLGNARYDSTYMETQLGTEYIPCRPDPEEGKVVDLRVDYLNPKPDAVQVGEPPVVILVRRFEEGHAESLLAICSDLGVYEVPLTEAVERKPQASSYLGMGLRALTKGQVLERIGGPPRESREKYLHVYTWEEWKQKEEEDSGKTTE